MMDATWIALIPPLLAIIISLITKEVNLSLVVGIVVGCGLYCGFNPFTTVTTMFDIMSTKVYGNMGVLFFIILLGMIVHLMNMSGANKEVRKMGKQKIKNEKASLYWLQWRWALLSLLMTILIA